MIVDCFNHVPDKTSFRFQLEVLACSSGYVKMFGPRMASGLGIAAPASIQDEASLFADLLANSERLPSSRRHMIETMDAAGIDVTVVHAEDLGPDAPVQPLPSVYWEDLLDECGGRVKVLASLHPARGAQGLADLRAGVRDGVYVGLFLSPFQQKARISTGDYDDILRCCLDLGIPVWVHCGMHWDRSKSLDEDRPAVFDNLCVAFPDLCVIAGHAGWPWMLEMCALAWKHANLYLELSAHRPRYLRREASGWEPLFNFGAGVIKDKVLLGTASVLMGMTPQLVLDEYRALGLAPETFARWLGLNAVPLYRLTDKTPQRLAS